MASCLKTLFLVLIGTTISWIYLLPSNFKFGIKAKVYTTLLKEPSIIDANQNVTVTLSLGTVVGTTIKPNLVDYYKETTGNDVKNVHQFLGIPFAVPPVNELRFKKPKPVQKWSPKVIEAVNWKPDCLQINKLWNFDESEATYSEDCLYLNIWTPSLPSTVSTKLKPVLVWIYPGGLTIGGSSHSMNQVQTLASTQDIVVVTFNYRLGPFGFLVSPDATSAPGNAGLWDQVAALEWVQDHVNYFGGDPNQVTIAGLSGGSFSTSALFVSPATRNLFNDAVMMSGSSLIPTLFNDRSFEVPKSRHLASVVNCPVDDDKLMMDCLMKIEAEKLIIEDAEVNRRFPYQESFGIGMMIFSPIIGDDLLPDQTYRLFNSEDVKKMRSKTRILSGITNWEGGIMKMSTGFSDIVDRIEATKIVNTNQIDWINGIKNYLITDYKADEKEAENIANYYLKDVKSSSSHELIDKESKLALFHLIGDLTLTCPAMIETDTVSNYVKSVHHYVFSYQNQNNEFVKNFCYEKDLVCHGLDIGYWFGNVLLKSSSFMFENQDYDQSIQALNLFGSFARKDKLMVNEKDEWTEFDTRSKTSFEVNIHKKNPFINNFRGNYCNLIKKIIVN